MEISLASVWLCFGNIKLYFNYTLKEDCMMFLANLSEKYIENAAYGYIYIYIFSMSQTAKTDCFDVFHESWINLKYKQIQSTKALSTFGLALNQCSILLFWSQIQLLWMYLVPISLNLAPSYYFSCNYINLAPF